ncbi:MAG: Fe-S oxidoreductase [Fimbriiglobus sp.]
MPSLPVIAPDDPPASAAAELAARMRKPQRHRLLHGYPLAAALPSADAIDPGQDLNLEPAGDRGLLVGVLPHPFCNPQVTGCGYCTFPHEPGNEAKTREIVGHVAEEILSVTDTMDERSIRRPVTALYFGGGTANLTDAANFRMLCRVLAGGFDLTQAEVTLEGVPAYFLRGSRLRGTRLMDVMRKTLPARHFRVSMGIQTFDPARLKRMGRAAFGDGTIFGKVVELAHRLGFTASADLLFNLPHQTLPEMLDDVRRATELGLDHLGLYHLVLFAGLGTEWSKDPALLAGLPDNDRAADHWLALRDWLLSNGWVQTSLTNFERAEFRGRADRFVYEESSFRPDRFDALGFGPGGISYTATADFARGLKVMNPTGAAEYTAAVRAGGRVWDRHFAYGPRDQRIFWLTRRLAALSIERDRYRELFGTDPLADFPEEFDAVTAAGLVSVTADAVAPTPRGMFFADSVAAVLASRHLRESRAERLAGDRPGPDPRLLADRANENRFAHM